MRPVVLLSFVALADRSRYVKFVLSYLFVNCCLISLSFATESDVDSSWNAQWIISPDVSWREPQNESPTASQAQLQATPNQWFCFRRQLELRETPTIARARVACDSKYWLWVNGELVVFEGQLKRGPAPDKTYFDIVDLQEHLRRGKNTIAVLVWYFGKQGFSHQDSGQPGLCFELDVGDQTLLSDSQWRVRTHPAFGETGKPHPNYRLPESNIHFDAQADITDWQQHDFDDSDWLAAVEKGRPPCSPWNQLTERPIPLWRFDELTKYTNSAEFPEVSDGTPVVAELPYNAQVTPYLKVEATTGQTIDIRTDNYRGGSAPNVRTEYVTREGIQEFETPGWMNGHSVKYSIPAGVKILSLKYRETGYDCDFSGKFQCNDTALNTLWKKSQRTLYVTMRDTYMDCPDRERAQWWGDVVIESGEAFYALDPASHHLAKKGILELANWQKSGGELYSPVPAGNWDKELPTQMLASIGPYGFWNYYLHTGDRATIEAVYPAVKRYMSLWQLGEDGLVVARKGGWTWGDWGEHKDMPLLFNGWYYLALDSFAKMADLTGSTEDAKHAIARRKTLADSFNKHFWVGDKYRSPNYKGETDERGHALAVVAGLAQPSLYSAIKDVLVREQHASPYMEKYVLEALFRMGHADEALSRMKLRYRAMIDSPLTTLWEGWGIGNAGFGGGTYNHAWSGGPLTLLSQFVTGIEPLEPAYREFAVRPQLGNLAHAEATVDSIAGKIRVSVERSQQDFRLDVEVPPGAVAVVTLPIEYETDLMVNDESIARGVERDALKDVSEPSGERKLRLQSGQYKLTASRN